MSTHVDATDISTVVWCALCPYWSVSASSVDTGHDAAVRHEDEVHPESRYAYKNRWRHLHPSLVA